jgi:hypothetical protein
VRAARSQASELAEYLAEQEAEVERTRALARRAQSRSHDPTARAQVAGADRELQESLTAGFLPTRGSTPRGAPREPRELRAEVRARIEVALARAAIEQTTAFDDAALPVDAIAVGHYLGVRPQYAELALDQAVSAALRGGPARGAARAAREIPPEELLLTQYADRGILRGELGQPFFLADPRPQPKRRGAPPSDRVIAIAGMGVPGRFGTPELTVLARELCWALGRLGKRHLATVLIGSGSGHRGASPSSRWIRAGSRRSRRRSSSSRSSRTGGSTSRTPR